MKPGGQLNMAYFIQAYGDGHINRTGNRYQLIDAEGKEVGDYASVKELAEANPFKDGKQAKQDRGRVDAGKKAAGEGDAKEAGEPKKEADAEGDTAKGSKADSKK
ncbi:hypothetical protein [Streptomyces sp. BBFR109]|uniref:hypothetical protein n=1 Tax=Streptomyces sp. BBFR109 TaxID=3448172 RepID=UPI003F77369F